MDARTCDHCGATSDGSDRHGGPDPCLGLLPGVISACCGHGRTQGNWQPFAPYVWFEDGREFAVAEAVAAMRALGGNPPDVYQPPMNRQPHLLSAVSRSRA